MDPEGALKIRFGPEARITRVGAIWVVHLDHPAEATVQERLAEVQREVLEPADCPLCESERPQAGDTLIYDEEARSREPAPRRNRDPDLN